MPRRRNAPAADAAPAVVEQLPPVHVIHEHGVYHPDQFRAIFRLSASSLRREVREGRLRVYKRCGRYYLTGDQILAWLRGGEVIRGKPAACGANGNGHAPEGLS
jgi:hypothetical protein